MVSGGFSRRTGNKNQGGRSGEDLDGTKPGSHGSNQTGMGAGVPLRDRPDLSAHTRRAQVEAPNTDSSDQEVFESALDRNELNFDSQNFVSIHLEQAEIEGLSFVESELRDFIIRDASLRNSNFSNASCRGLKVDDVDLENSNFNNADLNGSIFKNTGLKKSTMRDCDLYGSSFQDVDLALVDFSDSDLGLSTFTDVELAGASFQGADLSGASFEEVHFEDTDFTNASLEDINVQNCEGTIIISGERMSLEDLLG